MQRFEDISDEELVEILDRFSDFCTVNDVFFTVGDVLYWPHERNTLFAAFILSLGHDDV